MVIIVGIDPGYSGAIATLDPAIGTLLIEDMPTTPNTKGKVELNLHQLASALQRRTPGRCLSLLEKVATMPGQGISSAFRFGQGYGAIEMALVGHDWERHYVTPSVWKKYFGLSKNKGASRSLACQRFPDQAHLFARVKDDGRAEAALIALYAKEKLL